MKMHRIKAIILRHLITWPRNLEQITDIFWWPVLEVLLWGFFTLYLGQTIGGSVVVSYLLGAVIFWAVININQFQSSMTFMREAWDRNLLNFFSSPLTIWEFLIGGLSVSLIKLIIGVIVMSLLSVFLYHFNIFKFGWYFIPFLISLTLMGWSVSLFVTGLILRFGWKVQSFAWTILSIVQPFSAVYYPLNVLPDWAQKIGLMLPSTYIFEGMREIVFKGGMNTNYLLISFFLNVLYLILALLFYRKMFKVAFEKGLLIRFV
ncbi:ABC transporter permease [Candidatus Microgenomates bacterium]|nr:ABC transporter permease [Candidatus Microgenomates bacterium]